MLHYTQKSPKNWTDRQKAQWQEDLGQRLRDKITDQYGYRQEYVFAKAIGISQGSLSDIINGKSLPSAYTLIKMARVSEGNFDIESILGGY